MLIKKPHPEWACYKCVVSVARWLFLAVYTTVAVAKLSFALLDLRKAVYNIWTGLLNWPKQ